MRACRSGFRTRLSTGVGREPRDGLRVGIFAAPAVIRPRLLDQGGITTRAPPALGLVRARVLISLLHLIRVPFPDTPNVGYSPADGAGPELGAPQHFVCADDALVLTIIDILMDTRGQVCC